jgi:hypothetical protein
MKHKHHIIPKHIGGTDDPSNLIELSVEEHAEAHHVLYKESGRWQDYLAWKGLLGLITEEERMEIIYAARRGEGNFFYGKTHTEETKKKISNSRKGKAKGLKQSPEWIEKRKMVGDKNPMYGKPSPNKGKKQPCSEEKRLKHPLLKTIIYNGVEYNGINEAARKNNTSYYKIKKGMIIK